MPRKYTHIKQYEDEILHLKEKGYSHREIGEKLGKTIMPAGWKKAISPKRKADT